MEATGRDDLTAPAPPAPVLWFLPTFVRDHDPVPAEGWHADGEPFRLYPSLGAAEAAAVGPDGRVARVLVLDGRLLDVRDGAAAHVPRGAVRNVDPDGDYWRPAPVEAGGGVVVRPGAGGPEVLTIFRRGAWDLPKGKLDDGETPQRAARREVAEEVGVKKKRLVVLSGLGTTLHDYHWPSREAHAVKTTHWFAMATTAERFKPETREGIEAVAWAPWAEARDRVGFETLRELMDRLDPAALAEAAREGLARTG